MNASSTTPPLSSLHVTIVGMGLMGASLAYDLKGHCRKVSGVVRRPEAVQETLATGCVDEATTDMQAAVAGADMVILATPVRTILRQIPLVGQMMRPGAILLDMGSTKQAICGAMHVLPEQVQALGGHPMCGKEQAGLAAAEAGLYHGCTFVLCPLPRTSPATLRLVHELLAHIGARPLILEPARHDKLVAAISHLPYLAACGLVAHTRHIADTDPRVWDVAASGFRDSSRVAASDVNMLLDILLTNRPAVLTALADFQAELQQWQAWLAAGDEENLRRAFSSIAAARRNWQGGGESDS